MSSNTYTLKIDIDDSKIRDLEKRLSKLMSGTATGGMAGVSGAATGKTGAGGNIAKNIGKLGLIAIGVGSLVQLVKKLTSMIVDSSPMLKGMLKLLNYSVMLILRPIGDFFGFFLRPLVVYFLRSVALPFYKQWRPIAQKIGTWLGIQLIQRQSQIDEIGGKKGWEEGFKWETDGIKNLEKQILGFSSFLSIFDKDETQFKQTKEAIAAFKGAFTAINGFTIPTLDTTWLDTWVKNNLSIDKFPTLDISAIQTKINSAITALVPSFSLTGIQDKIDAAVTAIATFDVAEVFTTIGEKIWKIFDGLIDGIFDLIPFVDRPDSGSSKVDTTSSLPPYAGTLDYNFSNDQNMQKPEEDPITSAWTWAATGVGETIKGWGV